MRCDVACDRDSRRAAILRRYEDPAVLPTKPDSLVLRRTEGYAASERMIQDRTVCLCSVQDGEILGDTELVHNLSTYMQTVVCTANTQVSCQRLRGGEMADCRPYRQYTGQLLTSAWRGNG